VPSTESATEFRRQLRAFLAGHHPGRPPKGHAERLRFEREWAALLADAGWAAPAWPKEWGGMDLPAGLQLVYHEEMTLARAPAHPSPNSFIVGPALLRYGTAEQKERFLRPIVRAEELWCQGFSEPGAGSDLASLRTRAIIDGDHLVINGQKIWTSYADVADYQELLVRTDPDAPKHRGITWLICDMHTPGITIRPIETIDGHRHFCEVYYDDVRIPLANVVGEVNTGWQVALTTLSFERGTAFMAEQVALSQMVERLVALCRKVPGPTGDGPAIDDDDAILAKQAIIAGVIDETRDEKFLLRSFREISADRGAIVDLGQSDARM